jgi:PQQ-like domain
MNGFAQQVLIIAAVLPFGRPTISAATIPHPAALQRAASSYIIRNSGSQVNWPQLGFDSGHSAYNPNESTISTQNVGQLQQAWSFSTGSGNNAGNVVEANGVVYAPSANGTVYAINASTGKKAWSFASGTGYTSSGSAPAYDNGMVFTVCNTSASTQGICALDAMNAALVWSHTLPGSSAYAGTPPVVAYGQVFFEGCASVGCSYLSLHEKTGHIIWKVAEPQGTCEGNGGITPAVYEHLLFVGFTCIGGASGAIVELNADNGDLVGQFLNSYSGQNAGLSVARGIAYVMEGPCNPNCASHPPSTQFFSAYDVSTTKAVFTDFSWGNQSVSYPSLPAITPIRNYETIGGWLYSEKNNGRRCRRGPWCRPIQVSSWPSAANGVVYTACSGSPCGIDGKTQALLWSGTGARTYGVPIIVNGVVYGACNGSNVCAWTLPSMIPTEAVGNRGGGAIPRGSGATASTSEQEPTERDKR